MKKQIWKNPDAKTRALIREVADNVAAIAPWEEITESELKTWLDAQPEIVRSHEIISVTARQLFPVLRRAHGITEEAIEAALGNPEVIPDADDRIDALIELRRVYIIERTHPFVTLLAGVFGLTDAQIDAAFIAAEKR